MLIIMADIFVCSLFKQGQSEQQKYQLFTINSVENSKYKLKVHSQNINKSAKTIKKGTSS